MSSHHGTPVVWPSRKRQERNKRDGWGRVVGGEAAEDGWALIYSLLGSGAPGRTHPCPVPAQVLLQATGAGMCHLENGCIVGQAVSRYGTGEVG